MELLRTEFSPRCMPPWEERDLVHKVDEAERKPHRDARGHLVDHRGSRPSDHVQLVAKSASVTYKIIRKPLPPLLDTVTRGAIPGLPALASLVTSGETQSPPPPNEEPPAPINDGLMAVPGCRLKRPPEIEIDDAEWRKLEASGFANEPLVQLAAWLFGPGCKVLETGREPTRSSMSR